MLIVFSSSCSHDSPHLEEITPDDIYMNSVRVPVDTQNRNINIVDKINNLKHEELAVVLVLTESCDTAAKFFPVLNEVKENVEKRGGSYILIDSKTFFESDDITRKIVTWMRKTFGANVVPTVAVYKYGELVDFFQESSSHEDATALLHMMYRNNIINEFPGYASTIKDLGEQESDSVEKRLQSLRVVDAYDLRGENLSNMNLEKGVYNGTNFSNADLRNTSFDRSTFFNANLCGANINGASLMGIRWKNTICPDGSNSDVNGNSCVKNREMLAHCESY